ncbi:P-loop containing nucleoside triphosphate hydrolase [Cladorrhinum sp. PSN332]|nr:P-loop containing nucleoside triphosphate hydrolase [Cladorrhinum sp. PSN332]
MSQPTPVQTAPSLLDQKSSGTAEQISPALQPMFQSSVTTSLEGSAASNLMEINPDFDYDGEGENCEIHIYENRIDARGDLMSLRVKGTQSEVLSEKCKSHTAALVLIRGYNINRELEKTTLQIRSPHLTEAIREVIQTYPGVKIGSTGRIVLYGEPRCLFHYRHELHAYAEKSDNPDLKKHMHLLLQYVVKKFEKELLACRSMANKDEKEPSSEHSNLWMFFKPGVLIYWKANGVEFLYRLWSTELIEMEGSLSRKRSLWHVKLGGNSSNGFIIGQIPFYYDIHSYDGYRPITELDIFPLEFHPEKQRIASELLSRGRRYVSLLKIHHVFYDGAAWIKDQPSGTSGQLVLSSVRNRIMVDCKRYYQSYLEPKFIPGTAIFTISDDRNADIDIENLLIFVARVPGYSFVHKRWGLFNLTMIRDIDFSKDAFDSLVLQADKKNLLSSLIAVQQDQEGEGFDDLIEGKGKGLILLLYGPPGVGKTFTAESIADRTKRPLLPVNSGQLIGPSTAVEMRLEETFQLATRWEAIVLLDEADVFLQQRSPKELDRNALVSCLLRVVEYFDGIMILTTNRFEAIDSAFKSRIHLCISYPPFSVQDKTTLWKASITRACGGKAPSWLNRRMLNQAAEARVNGREIRNIVRMAHALARNGRREMKAEDIFQGIAAMDAFETDRTAQTTEEGPSSAEQAEA